MLPGGKERMGEHEGGEGYLRVVSVDAGVVGEVPAMEAVRGGARRGVRRRSARRAAVLRRGRTAVGRPESTSRSRATHSDGWFERRSTGMGARCAGGLGGGGGLCSGELMAGVAVWELREVPREVVSAPGGFVEVGASSDSGSA
jgi:hypothetical protein